MIRINLMAPEKPSQKKKAAAASPGTFGFWFLIALFGGGALVADGALYAWKSQAISRLDKKIGEAKERQKKLQAIKAQVDALEIKRKTYQNKVDLIERLRREQADPVHMLDEISKALPDFVWLKTLDQSGPGIKITGMSSGLIAVADFVSNLQRSGWFPQVDMGLTKEAKEGGAQALEFIVTATFKNPETAAREAAEAAAAAAAKPTPAASPGKKKR
jgi:type IV pilus assembly protein PilN